ncbi:MAG: ribbon-helix-helix domain-containing protein [Promethearchaeota archaeon]
MKIVPIHIPERYLEGLDALIEYGLYPNRSEAIRMAVRDLLKSETNRFRKTVAGK